MKNIPEFEGLRGMLSLLVVLGHVYVPVVAWIWGCMDVFFCLSGFLISTVIIQGQSQRGFYKRYALRRILRIWPSFYAVFAVCAFLAWLHMRLAVGAFAWSPGAGTLLNLLFLQYVDLWAISDFDQRSQVLMDSGQVIGSHDYLPFLGHTWSVALEEQFYIVAPMIMWGLWKTSRPWLWASLGLILAIAIGLAGRSAGFFFLVLPYRFEAFATGILLGCLFVVSRHSTDARYLGLRIALGSGAAALAVLTLLYSLYLADGAPTFENRNLQHPLFVYGVTAFATLAGALVWIFATCSGDLRLGFFRLKPLRLLGQMSYSTYLWHIPTLYFLAIAINHWPPIPDSIRYPCEFVVCLLVGWAAYLTIEKPLLAKRSILAKDDQRIARSTE